MPATTKIVRTLKTVSIFTNVPEEALVEIASLLEEVDVPAGTAVINKGDVGDCMYLVASGRLRLHDGARTLDEMGAGDVFGEMALLDSSPRSASVTTIDDVRLFRLGQEPFYRLMAERSEVAVGIIRVLSGRLRARLRDVSSLYDRKEEVEHELEIGRQIQEGFLPEVLPQPPGWEIAACFSPAKEVAGDFYDAFPLAGGSMLGIVIADVSGKGVGAALFMALIRTLIRAQADLNFSTLESTSDAGDTRADAAVRTISHISNYMARVHGRAHMFATIFFGVLDVASGLMVYVSGGHDAPAIIGPDGVKQRIMPTGPAVGLLPNMPFRSGELYLDPDDTLVTFTDGVTDAHDPQGVHFGQERLMALIAEPQPSASALVVNIEAQLEAHIGGARQFDDVTLLLVRRKPSV